MSNKEELVEGKVKKGGVNSPPTSSRPEPPKAQEPSMPIMTPQTAFRSSLGRALGEVSPDIYYTSVRTGELSNSEFLAFVAQ